MDTYGSHQEVGYDIGCKVCETLAHSSIGAKAEELGFAFVVNAFHGHAHNHLCQLCHHLLYQLGIGLEDLETCECIFTGSNSVTHLIHHASYFHWLQFLELHFQQWDKDRYAELSKSLCSEPTR
jgi:hypothetical protein